MLLSTSGKKIGAAVAVVAVCCALGFGYWLTRRAPKDVGPRPTAPALAADVAHDDPVFGQVAEAIEACATEKEAPPFQLLLQRAVLKAKRGHKDEAAKLFQRAADRVAARSDYQRCQVLSLAAYNLADAGDADAVRALLAESRQQGATITDANQAGEILCFAAVIHAEGIDPAEALPFAQAIPDENCRLNAFRDIAAERAKRGDVESALRTVELIQTPYGYFKLKPWEAIATAQLQACDRAGAEATLALALAAVEQERTLNIGGWRMNQVQVLARYAAAQGQAGDREGARATFERVEKVIANFDGPAPASVFVTLALA
jgi:ATP/maltotriose-dependent transcriptional regulator MalT